MYQGPFLPKADLVIGDYYKGHCRNARIAKWQGDRFVHLRTKFGHTYAEEICHPDDEKHFDVFFPTERIDL